MKTNDKLQIVPLSVFQEAALKYFKCKSSDIEITMISENKEALLIYNEDYYRISTREQLWEDIEFQLSDKDAVHHINFECWIQATKHTVVIKRFLDKLINTLSDLDHANKLYIALGLASNAEDFEIAFWNVLYKIDEQGELLGNAMVSVAQIYDGIGLIDDLLELQIIHGEVVYNRVEGGIFEQVFVKDSKGGHIEFFLYSIEDYFTE